MRPFEGADDLFARTGVLDRCRFGVDAGALLDDLASGDAEVVLLQTGAAQSRRLLDCAAQMAVVFGRAHRSFPAELLTG